MRLGITPERIRPGHPEENGRLERLHKTLKAETTKPPRHSLRQQQHAFNRFREEYNYERPHEALGQRPPSEFYAPSTRISSGRLPASPDYDHTFHVRKVKCNGYFSWKDHFVYITMALVGQYIGLLPTGNGKYTLYFNQTIIGELNEKTMKINEPKTVR